MSAIHDVLDREEIVLNPVKDYPGYYHFPEYNHIGINKEGTVIDIKTGNEIRVSKKQVGSKFRHYIALPVYLDNGIKKFITYNYPRLIAKTFVGRPNIHKDISLDYLQVNHIDCNPSNNLPDNLEWCTAFENTNHSFNNYNNSQQVPIIVRNIENNKEVILRGLNKTSDFLNIAVSSLTTLLPKYSGGLEINGWNVKYNDESKWKDILYKMYEARQKSVYVKNIKTGEIKKFEKVNDASDFLGINYFTLALHIRSESYLKYRYNDWVISLNEGMSWPNIDNSDESKNFLSNSLFVVKDLVNDKEYSFGSRVDCYNFLGILEGRFRSYVDQGNYKKFRLGKFIIRKFGDDDYPDLNMDSPDYPHNKSTIVEIKNIHSNEVMRFESVGEASRYLDVKRATLSNALLKGFNYRYRIGDWIVRREDQEWPELNMAHSSLRPAVESRDYTVLEMSSGNITIVSGITEVSRLVGASRGRVDRGLKKDNVVQINGYEISYYE